MKHSGIALVVMTFTLAACIPGAGAKEKIILDTDMVMLYDDGVAMGTRYPLRAGRFETIELERKMFRYSSPFIGCFARAEPDSYLEVFRKQFGKDPTIKPVGTEKVRILLTIDEGRFRDLMVGLLTK